MNRVLQSSFLRQATATSWKRATVSTPSMPFHANARQCSSEKSEEEVTAVQAIEPEQSALNDWKIMTPIGLALAIPAINNGIYVINEETQLACCFALFCTSVYKFGGDMIGSYFDEKAAAILSEQNAVEDMNIAIAKETVQAHELQLAMVEDIDVLYETQKEMTQLLCQLESQKLRHQVRDVFQKNLDTIVAYENMYLIKMQENMVEYATTNVRATVSAGGKGIKENAFKDALAALSKTSDAALDEKQDEIVKLFCTNLHEYGAKIEKQEGSKIQLTTEQQQQLAADLEVYLKRVDMDEAVKVSIPKEITFELIK